MYKYMTGEMVPMECSKSAMMAFYHLRKPFGFFLAFVTTHFFLPPHTYLKGIYAGLKLVNSLKMLVVLCIY